MARNHLEIYIKRVAKAGTERALDEFVGRLFLVAENRSWLEEILNIGREKWQEQLREEFPYHQPNSRFRQPE